MIPAIVDQTEERIGNYRVHPVAAMFPLMEGEAYESLKESIEKNGQLVPIVLLGNVLLDGRNRLRICLELNKQPKVEQYQGALVPGEYIWQMNYERRDLDDDQRFEISQKAAPVIRAEALERQRTAAAQGGKTAGRGRPKNSLVTERSQGYSIKIEDDKPAPPPKPKRAPPARKQLAEKMGVSERKAQQFLNVMESAPELLDDVKAKKVPLAKAARVAAERRPKRRKPSWNLDRAVKNAQKYFTRLFAQCPTDQLTQLKKALKEVINATTN